MRNEWQLDRTRTCSDDGVIEVDGGWAVFAFHNVVLAPVNLPGR